MLKSVKNIFILLFFLCGILLKAQNHNETDLTSSINNYSEFIASSQFHNFKNNQDDLSLIDSLFVYAKSYQKGDISEALLGLTFACLPYNKLNLVVPLFNVKLNVPLPSSNDSLFNLKNKFLPSHFFFDSSLNDFGDKDKLSHFFGNAFLSYNVSLFNLSKFMGIFVELFEESFKLQGSVDHKDLIVDNLGEYFGYCLKENENFKPSEALALYQLFYLKIVL